jgi:hypothetical protein
MTTPGILPKWRKFGEASMSDNGLTTGEQARVCWPSAKRWQRVSHQLESWLSPWATPASICWWIKRANLPAAGELVYPLQDNNRYLSWNQLASPSRRTAWWATSVWDSAGAGDWLLGYNTFYDKVLDENLARAGLGRSLGRISAPVGQLLSAVGGWRDSLTQEQRMARGYDVTAQARLPFYQHLNTSVSVEQYFGDSVDLFHSGTGYHNPVAVSVGLNYTPFRW